jgi:hypothetical protein
LENSKITESNSPLPQFIVHILRLCADVLPQCFPHDELETWTGSKSNYMSPLTLSSGIPHHRKVLQMEKVASSTLHGKTVYLGVLFQTITSLKEDKFECSSWGRWITEQVNVLIYLGWSQSANHFFFQLLNLVK